MVLIKDIKEFSILPVRGIDRQLLWQFEQLFPNLLVSIENLNIQLGQGLFPYCQTSTKNALRIFLEAYGKPLTINNAYRSVVAQTVLYNNKNLKNNRVGEPGKSDHQNGISLDIEEWEQVKNLLIEHGWKWTYEQTDAMHFDWTNDIEQIKDKTVKAFQSLWNNANAESEHLIVDGDLGDIQVSQTFKCINNSPAEGFPNVGYPRTLRLTEPIQNGEDVGELQLALRKAGIKLELADQVFGTLTDQAVKEFQKANSLKIDGIVSAEGETRKALMLITP